MNIRQLRKIIILTIFLSLIMIPYSASTVQAQFNPAPNILRVALGLNLSSAEFAVTEGEYLLVDYMTQMPINPNIVQGSPSLTIAPAGSTNLQISGVIIPGLTSNMVLLQQKNPSGQNNFRFKNKRYRGDLLLENINGKLQVINLVDIEQYLYGVIGSEIGSSSPNEALKAQAVVSRTYALYYKEHPQLYYDVGITTQWQVYSGYDGELMSGDRVKAAVDATKGQAIYYNGSPIQAFFHSNSGGFTENCENVWYASIPYIKPVAAPEDAYALTVAQYDGWPASSYQWEKTFTKAEINALISQWNREHPTEPIRIGEFKELRASRLAVDPDTHNFLSAETQSKRVTQLDFVGTQGVESFYKDRIRSVLDLRSTLFNIFTDSMVTIWNAFGTTDAVSDTRDTVGITVDGYKSKLNGNNGNYYVVGADGVKTVPKQFTSLTINGKGYGHGLGMSQWGARGLAVQGSDYQRIIMHYYNQDKNDGTIQIKSYQ